MTPDVLPTLSPTQTVSEQLPPIRSDVPRPPRTVRGLLSLPGMVLLWIMPGRMGPCLAAAGWRAAIAAHLIALLFSAGMIVWVEEFKVRSSAFAPPFKPTKDVLAGPEGLSEWLRAPLAALVLAGRESSGFLPGAAWLIWFNVLAFEGGLILLALSIMPFVAAGEKSRRLFGRCMRLVLWNSTAWLLLGLAWFSRGFWDQLLVPVLGLDWIAIPIALLLVFSMWWMSTLLRSCRRYTGAADGPAWQPRIPVCYYCGYNISRLPISTNCPECGSAVATSLPKARRKPSYATADGHIARIRGFWGTFRAVVFDNSFFLRIAVSCGHTEARRFFFRAAVLNAILIFLSAVLFGQSPVVHGWGTLVVYVATFVISALCFLLLVQLLTFGLAASLLGLIARLNLQATSTACFYAFAATTPLGITSLALIAI